MYELKKYVHYGTNVKIKIKKKTSLCKMADISFILLDLSELMSELPTNSNLPFLSFMVFLYTGGHRRKFVQKN